MTNRVVCVNVKMSRDCIEWGRGSSFNHGRIPGSSIRVERSRNDNGWTFLISNDEVTYLYVDSTPYATKEELENAVFLWIHRNKKLTI